MRTAYTANSHYGGTCVSLSVKCCYPSISLQEGVYLYGIHLVLVTVKALNERLLPQMMTLQHLSQLFLYSKHTNSCRGRKEKDLKLEFQLEWVKETHCENHFVIDSKRMVSLMCCCVLVSLLLTHVLHHTSSYKRVWRLNLSQCYPGNIW